MISYSILMFLSGILFFIIAARISRGSITLIKDKPEKKKNKRKKTKAEIKKEAEYKKACGREFSRGMFGISGTMILSGVISLVINSMTGVIIALVIVFIGSIICAILMMKVLDKYEKNN